MPFARCNDSVLHYRLSGPETAPALVFVNALGTDARIWDAVIARLPGYRCLSYDKRGHGLSGTPPGDYSLEDHLSDLESLLEHVGLGKAVLIGVSVGGVIGQGLALRAPQRLKGLVLCDTAPRMGDAEMWNQRIAAVREHGMAAIADAVMTRWFSPEFRRDRQDEVAGWRNLLLRADPGGYAATCATLRDTDLTAVIGGIALPTLVVVGEDDLASPVELVRSCARTIPGARFEILAGAGHIPSIDQPDNMARLIADFLNDLGHG
jgi:3-oxoadipate enol-lactonase